MQRVLGVLQCVWRARVRGPPQDPMHMPSPGYNCQCSCKFPPLRPHAAVSSRVRVHPFHGLAIHQLPCHIRHTPSPRIDTRCLVSSTAFVFRPVPLQRTRAFGKLICPERKTTHSKSTSAALRGALTNLRMNWVAKIRTSAHPDRTRMPRLTQ